MRPFVNDVLFDRIKQKLTAMGVVLTDQEIRDRFKLANNDAFGQMAGRLNKLNRSFAGQRTI